MTKTLASIGEFGLIERVRKAVPAARRVVVGIGDDAAVLESGLTAAKEWLLMTTDMLAEGTHFMKGAKPQHIGHKALACSISDIAAMGGVPTFAVISLGAPAKTRSAFLQRMQSAMIRTADRYGVLIVGGDTIRHRQIVINVAMLGWVKKPHLVTRSGAQPGDVIFVSGPLGRSLASGRHLTFSPRLAEAQYLVQRCKPSAMIDISDGLASDLGHILDESRVGAVLHADWIPRRRKASLRQALYDGEDYELLFTLSADKLAGWKRLKNKPYSFFEIGKITDEAGCLRLMSSQRSRIIRRDKGFAHF